MATQTARRDDQGRFQKSIVVSLRRHRTLDLYWQHWSREEIAAELNITLDMVAAYIRQGRAASDPRAEPRLQKRVMAARARRAQIRELAASMTDPREIAKTLNVSVKLVQIRLREGVKDAA